MKCVLALPLLLSPATGSAGIPERYGSMGGGRRVRVKGASHVDASPEPRFVTQRQDHFDGSNPNTWKQAYYVNDTFFKAGSAAPVFLCVGGEGPPMDGSAVVDSVHCSIATEWLRETGALMFALEHRYYGCHNKDACPVDDLRPAGALKFHSSRQALSDLAHFVEFANKKYSLSKENRWVTFGGSYPGMLASFARLKFPHLVSAAVSSSAPVRAELDMRGYNDVVAQAYSVSHERVGGSPECSKAIGDGHRKIGEMLRTSEGRQLVAKAFGNDPDWYANHSNQVQFAGQGVASFPAQSNDVACKEDACNIAKICAIMTNSSLGDEVVRLAAVAAKQPTAGPDARRLAAAEETPTPGYGNGDQLWAWQTCTEFGFYQTCEEGSRCFYTQGLATLDEEMSFCQQQFKIEKQVVADNIAFSNAYYGADHPEGSRVLYVNGEVDPWHANSILAPLSPELPAFSVAGASHHAWTHPSLATDQESVIAARGHIREVVKGWLEAEAAAEEVLV